MRIVCGPPWTVDGRWVVVAAEGRQDDCLACVILPEGACEYHVGERIVYDPDNGVGSMPDNWMLAWMDLNDCHDFVKANGSLPVV